ncbi:MAG: O-antigen ligase family protein, partial [Clostridia bacterium]|nr:O-antigen ligase family protein [Clostridia bacterium]
MPQAPKKSGRTVAATKQVTLLQRLHAFTAFLYACIAGSLFGQLRTVYARLQIAYENGAISAVLRSRRKRHDRLLFRMRLALASLIEKSAGYRLMARLRRTLLLCSLNTYGIFSFFFGCFTVVSYLMAQYFRQDEPVSYLVTGVAMIALSLPLLFSDKPLGRALGGSLVFRSLLVRVCGIPAEKLDGVGRSDERDDRGEEHYFLSLLLAVVMGLFCSLADVAPYAVPATVLIVVGLQLIMLYPEIGLLMIAFFAPLMTLFDGEHPTLLLLGGVGVTMLAILLKLIGGKRVFRPDLLDSCVLTLAALYLLGGLITRGGRASFSSALVYVALLCCYVLAVGLLRTQAWVRRIVGAFSVSLILVSLLGIAQYFFADIGLQYVDRTLFSDLGARVFSTLENPNMLAEYLILGLPVLLSVTVTQKRPLNGFWLLLGCGAVGACLVLTWSRGAWLGALVCALLFILLMGHKALSYLLLAAVPTVALIHYLPGQMLRRFVSIGSLQDSSIRYRVHLWEGVGKMLGDYWYCGVGVGEAAFCEVYSRYALPGIAVAMHAHNLYLQLLCERGVVGLIMFVVTVIMVVCYALSSITGRG